MMEAVVHLNRKITDHTKVHESVELFVILEVLAVFDTVLDFAESLF